MANLLKNIIVYGTAIVLSDCGATGLNVKKERKLSPKFGYEQIESNTPQSYSTYCPNGFIDPLTGICINIEPFLEPVVFRYDIKDEKLSIGEQNEIRGGNGLTYSNLEICFNDNCLPPRHGEDDPFPCDPRDPNNPYPQPPSRPFGLKGRYYVDSRQGMEEQPECCCPLGVELPCCKNNSQGRG